MYKDASSNDNLTVNIGLIGLGYIGSEVFKLIHEQHDYIMKKIGKDLKDNSCCRKRPWSPKKSL